MTTSRIVIKPLSTSSTCSYPRAAPTETWRHVKPWVSSQSESRNKFQPNSRAGLERHRRSSNRKSAPKERQPAQPHTGREKTPDHFSQTTQAGGWGDPDCARPPSTFLSARCGSKRVTPPTCALVSCSLFSLPPPRRSSVVNTYFARPASTRFVVRAARAREVTTLPRPPPLTP